DQGLKPRRPAFDEILDGMGESVIDDNLINTHSGPRGCDLLSPRGAADSEDHDYDPSKADGRQHPKPPSRCGTLPGSKNDPRDRVNANSHPRCILRLRSDC